MDDFLILLIYPRQRLKHVRTQVEELSDAVMRLYDLGLSGLGWLERREGVLARFEGGAHPEMLVRIPSAKLDCTALLLYLRRGGGWGYQLCCRGTVEDAFESLPGSPPNSVPPEQHAARLIRRFRADRERLLAWLAREAPKEDGFQTQALEDFLTLLAPWASGMVTAPLEPAPAPVRAPRQDSSSPVQNAPDASGQRLPEKKPDPETCLPFLTGVKALRRGWPFPLSLLYALFPKKRPDPETIPHQGWTGRELEEALEDFYSGKLDRLELEFTLNGAGTYIRRLQKTVYHPFLLTLELIREKQRCVCLLLDGQESTVYRLVADRDTYMNVDIKDLKKTVFHGQTVDEYTVFPKKDSQLLRREIPLLLARLEQRDGVLSATARMGVWSCDGLHFSREQHQQHRDAWCMK